MPKLVVEDDELDIDELEDAEYSEGQFDDYDGDIPPKGTILTGLVKKVWWTYTKDEVPMLKILFEAADNEGDLEEYNGCPFWENAALSVGAKFKWFPFLENFGLTLAQVKKNSQIEKEDDPKNGAPFIKIGKWEPGSDAAWCRIITARERYKDEWQARIGTWLPYEDDEEPEEEAEPEPPAKPARTRAAASKPAASGTRRTARSKPEPEPEEEPEVEEEEEKPPARSSRRATTAKPAAKATPRPRGRGRAPADDDPPF